NRADNERVPFSVWVFSVLSALFNLATGNYLNRLALFFSAHFVSSLFALAALFALWRTSES
ncbi:MAG TPA: hypothetical protein VGR40_10500, partial [Candidatus Binatus sp.]|nr:hypothetical protein [Candidatus Binatus sp.]